MWCIVNAPDATSGLNAYMCVFPQWYIVYFQGSLCVCVFVPDSAHVNVL